MQPEDYLFPLNTYSRRTHHIWHQLYIPDVCQIKPLWQLKIKLNSCTLMWPSQSIMDCDINLYKTYTHYVIATNGVCQNTADVTVITPHNHSYLLTYFHQCTMYNVLITIMTTLATTFLLNRFTQFI